MKFGPVCNPTIRKNFQEYPRFVNIFFLSPGFCTQDAISCTKQPHGIAWYTRGRSLFLYQPPITASLVRPKSFPCTKATLRCRLSTGMPFSPDKTALNQALSTRRHIWPEKMSCNSQSTHNSHFILANQIILFTFAIGFMARRGKLRADRITGFELMFCPVFLVSRTK